MVAPLSKCLYGDCQVQLENYEDGITQYLKAANMRDNTFTTPYSLMKAAKVQMHLEDWEGALESLERVEKDYKLTLYAANIDKEIARVKAGIK